MFLSETFSVIDANWYDDGVTDPKTVTWNKPVSLDTPVISNTGTSISNSTTDTLHCWANNYVAFDIGAFVIEFDLVSYTDDANAQFRVYGTDGGQFSFKGIGCPQNCHIKIMVTGSKVQYQIDNGTVTDWITTTNTSFVIGFRFRGVCTIKYKNFVVYPI